MHNDKEGRKSCDGISVIMSNDALLRFIEEIHRTHGANEPNKLCVPEDDDLPLCRGQDEPVCVTVTTEDDKKRRVQIMACPSYYIVYEICQDGTKVRLFKGKRGTVYGLMKRIAEDGSKA